VRVDLGPVPAKVISINESRSRHWTHSHSTKVLWRDTVAWSAKAIGLGRVVHGRPCVLRFEIPVPDKRRRDPHNYVGTVVKWAVDGLVLAGVFEDDSPEYVTVLEPVLNAGGDKLYLDIWERQED